MTNEIETDYSIFCHRKSNFFFISSKSMNEWMNERNKKQWIVSMSIWNVETKKKNWNIWQRFRAPERCLSSHVSSFTLDWMRNRFFYILKCSNYKWIDNRRAIVSCFNELLWIFFLFYYFHFEAKSVFDHVVVYSIHVKAINAIFFFVSFDDCFFFFNDEMRISKMNVWHLKSLITMRETINRYFDFRIECVHMLIVKHFRSHIWASEHSHP